MPRQSHPPWFGHPDKFGTEYKLWSFWSSSLCSFLQPPTTSFLLGPNILLSTLFSNALKLCPSVSAKDKFSRTYKSTWYGNISCFYREVSGTLAREGKLAASLWIQWRTLILVCSKRMRKSLALWCLHHHKEVHLITYLPHRCCWLTTEDVFNASLITIILH